MPTKPPNDPPLPKGWTRHIRSAFLRAVSLASVAMTVARARAATSRSRTRRLQAHLDRANAEIALLREELDIKDTRWSRVDSRRRPRFSPTQRMRILALRAARGWSHADTARHLLIDEQTLHTWMRRVDEQGERPLVQLETPANRLPGVVRHLVRHLKTLVPSMGKVRIAQVLMRAGLHLGPSTVARILREGNPVPVEPDSARIETGCPVHMVKAAQPGEVWHIDLTTIPTGAGFWVPWSPQALPQRWPFCWWLAVVLDHFSRAVVGFAVFKKQLTATEMRNFVRRAVRKTGAPPRTLVSDHGRQFTAKMFRRWCRKRNIRQRFGAVGQYGSIAVIERFFRSLKTEGTRRIALPFGLAAMRKEIDLYAHWYNHHRPHRALNGRTPYEVCDTTSAAPAHRATDNDLTLVVGFLEGRRHLPVVRLRRAA